MKLLPTTSLLPSLPSFLLSSYLFHFLSICIQVLVLHNNGAVAMGESIEEAFSIAHKLVKACEIQVSGNPSKPACILVMIL